MKKFFYQQKQNIALLLTGVIGIVLIVGSDSEEKKQIRETLKSVGTILASAWRTERNAILYLDSEERSNVAITIDMSEEPYPPNNLDRTFLMKAELLSEWNLPILKILYCNVV